MANKSILIAEDDPFLGDIWQRALAAVSYETHVVYDGQEAIEWLEANPLPLAVITDYNMPIKNGKDVLRYLASIDEKREVAAVMITANHVIHDQEAERLADMFLLKPVHVRDMVRLVQRLANHGV